jgi:hypothetical protein
VQGRDGTIFSSLDLAIDEDRCDIIAAGVSVGTMNKKTHLALKSLNPQTVYKVMVPLQEFREKLAAAKFSPGMASSNITCVMAIVLCGPRSIADSLAKDLSKQRLFLQHPDPRLPDTRYENPQYLSMVGSWLPNGAILAPISTDLFIQHETDRLNAVNREDAEDEVDLRAVMDNLPRPERIIEASIDGRVMTALLK